MRNRLTILACAAFLVATAAVAMRSGPVEQQLKPTPMPAPNAMRDTPRFYVNNAAPSMCVDENLKLCSPVAWDGYKNPNPPRRLFLLSEWADIGPRVTVVQTRAHDRMSEKSGEGREASDDRVNEPLFQGVPTDINPRPTTTTKETSIAPPGFGSVPAGPEMCVNPDGTLCQRSYEVPTGTMLPHWVR